MEFRPCIDIHNGRVKQIVGGSLKEEGNQVQENFVSGQDASFYAELYKKDHVRGGHVILLNAKGSDYYEETKRQAVSALSAYPGGLQVGGGICEGNAEEFLAAGASHVIVTSYVFTDGRVNYENLKKLSKKVGRERLTLDLSCRRRDGSYYIVTDRWQKFTKEKVTYGFLDDMAEYADEFLIHAVDVEGKVSGVEKELVELLGAWAKIPVTYAGGIGSFEDLRFIGKAGKGRLNVTVGSALDLFGGTMAYEKVLDFVKDYSRGM